MKSFIEFRKARLTYQIRGKGRTIILIHGFLGSKEIWKNYLPRLSKSFRVLAIDLPGHGESDCLGYLHHLEILADGLKAILKSLKIRKVIIVGHSLGGYIGLAYAEKYPDTLVGLVLLNSSAKGDSKKRTISRDQLIELVKKDSQRAIQLLIPTFFNTKKRNTHWLIKSYLKMAKSCSEQSIIATIEGMKMRKEREIILKFAPFPYLFIIGEKDSIFMKKDLIKQSKLSENGSYTILEESSHMSLVEEQEKVFRSIKNFAKANFS